jgi:hypothetical protein
MSVDWGAVGAIRSKLSRAYQNFEILDDESRRYMHEGVYAVVSNPQPDPTQHIFTLQVNEPIPMRWGILFGEAIHHLRSALDHVVFQLTLDMKGASAEGTGFPIITDPNDWARMSKRASEYSRTSGMYGIRELGPEVIAYVERLQPYPDRHPEDNVLLALHKIWNQDKHQTVQPWGYLVSSEVTIVSPVVGNWKVVHNPAVLHDGAEVFRIAFDQPNPTVQVHHVDAMRVAFENPADPQATEARPFWEFWDAAAGVVGTLLTAIGRQDRPLA